MTQGSQKENGNKSSVTRRIFLASSGTWLLPAQTTELAVPTEKPLARIGIVTDIHYADKPAAGTREYRASLAKLAEAVERWNDQSVDAVIELGDFVDASPTVEAETADLRRILRVLRKTRAPRHFALGNHCVLTLTKQQFLNEWGADRTWYSFPLRGYRCVVLDSAFTNDGRPYGGREFDWRDAFVPPRQLDWLQAELQKSTEPAIVFLHHRLDGDDHYSVSNAPAVRAVLEASGKVVAVFQGHNHINDYKAIGGIHYCTLKALVDGAPPDNSAYGTLDLYPGSRLHLNGFRLLESRELPAPARADFQVQPLEGLGVEPGVCRRDPSDVIRIAGTYFVWYTKVRNGPGIYNYPSGYSGDIWYATSQDGRQWTERSQSLSKGPKGAFDDFGVFTPGILAARGRFYLFYTAVGAPMSEQTPTAIGIAVADSPHGPWMRVPSNPVLAPTKDPNLFDSFRVDDACLIVRKGKYWLYYKGRQAGRTPRETKWGLVIAEHPAGPYLRRQPDPVLGSGHEVLVWPEREGVAALIGPTGPEKNTIQYATDGIHFRVVQSIADPPKAPGGYRPDAFTDAAVASGMQWGVSMLNGPDPYLVRFDMHVRIKE